MNYTDFIKCLFLIAGLAYVFILIYELSCRYRVCRRKADIYKQLKRLKVLCTDNEEDSRIRKAVVSPKEYKRLLEIQCHVLYNCYVKNDKYMDKLFSSANDILLKFISTENFFHDIHLTEYNLVSYDLAEQELSEHEDARCIMQPNEQDKKGKISISDVITITGTVVTVIGIIATIISFF